MLLVGALVLSQLPVTLCVILVAPASHTALTSDVEVSILPSDDSKAEVDFNDDLVVNMVRSDGDPKVVASTEVKGASVIFKCGSVDRAGRFCFQLVKRSKSANESDSLVAESELTHVHWPRVQIEVPSNIDALTANVTARVEVYGVVCYPSEMNFRSKMELIFFGNSMVHGPVSTRFLQDLSEFHRVLTRDVNIPCDFLDRPGFYQVHLRAEVGSPKMVAASNALKVIWSDQYHVTFGGQAVFPCPQTGVRVYYHHPKCILGRDKIRVFGRPRPSVSAIGAAHAPLEYLGEMTVVRDGGRVDFRCAMFTKKYPQFCFEYVSVSRDGAVANMKIECLQAYVNLPEISWADGSWGPWSSWTACSSTCGSRATRNRHRFCDSPTPRGGKFCEGPTVQVLECKSTPCPISSTPVSPVDLSPVSFRCRCGCQMDISGGAFIASSNRHCNSTSVWLLKVSPGHRLRLTFDFLLLEDRGEFLSARDGEFSSSQMILSVWNSGNTSTTPIPPSISTSNAVLLEFHPAEKPENKSTKNGFVLHVQEMSGSGLVSADNRIYLESSPPVLKSAVHWVSLSLCLLALATALALGAVYVTWRRARWSTREFPGGMRASVVSLRSQGSGYRPFSTVVTTTTSVSELSLLARRVKRRRKRRGRRKAVRESGVPILSPVSSDPELCLDIGSPMSEEVTVKQETTSEVPSRDPSVVGDPRSPPLCRRADRQVALPVPDVSKKLPVATVSPQPHQRMDDRKKMAAEGHRKISSKSKDEVPKTASTPSLAQTDGADFDLEYDYYDYDVHDVPGSFFSVDPSLLSWLPPFLPQLWAEEPIVLTSPVAMQSLTDLPVGGTGRVGSGDGNGVAETEMSSPVATAAPLFDGIEFADASDSESPKKETR